MSAFFIFLSASSVRISFSLKCKQKQAPEKTPKQSAVKVLSVDEMQISK